MYQLAIFDLDGTLLDTLADLRQGLNYALATQGFAPRTLPEVRAFVGNGIRKLIERAVPAGTGEAQIDAVFEDIRPDAVKIGMVSSSGLIKMIAERLQHYKAENIVVDPVMVATSGSRLLEEDAVDTLKKELLPIATVITPNIPEAEILCGMEIHTEEDMEAAAKAIYEDLGCAVLLKGGHNINDANDLLYTKEEVSWFKGKRINNPNTHGTGCTLSSAIAANLAKGFDLKISVQRAKDYISRALADMLDLGAGSGPMNHAFDLKDEWKEEA